MAHAACVQSPSTSSSPGRSKKHRDAVIHAYRVAKSAGFPWNWDTLDSSLHASFFLSDIVCIGIQTSDASSYTLKGEIVSIFHFLLV